MQKVNSIYINLKALQYRKSDRLTTIKEEKLRQLITLKKFARIFSFSATPNF